MKIFEMLMKRLPILLDGAMGTNLIAAGMPMGCCAEAWMLAYEDAVMDIQRCYAEAGSQIIYAPTFTAQSERLKQHGLDIELSIGVVTSLVGAAAFIAIFYRTRKAR